VVSRPVALTAKHLGNASSPDDAYQILRGFRTVVTRFRQQEATSLALANWLADHPKVQQVLHPAHSYGGFESLCIHCDPQLNRKVSDKLGGPLVRFACGLEAREDLKNDIEQAFNAIF